VNIDENTVFVLGAGFTKAFLPDAPLLVDDYYGDGLKAKFAKFPEALSILEMELNHPDHPPGQISLERLMTRLAGGMPYDYRGGINNQLALLLSEVKQSFVRRLSDAKKSQFANAGELWLFAGHCVSKRIDCITFNYDDLLDQALWEFFPRHAPGSAWNPDWGYGFPCRLSETCIRHVSYDYQGSPTLLLKLHGSVNWRVPIGQPRPLTPDGVTHHELWSADYHRPKVDLGFLEQYLDPDPFFVPPILTKTDLVEQPILRLIWSFAIEQLKKAGRVIFIGYSLPVTDVAASFLFREALGHLNHSTNVSVVDFAGGTEEGKKKLAELLVSYRKVFPIITEEQFHFCGAAKWIRENLTEWLYDSRGIPIAFLAHNLVISNKREVIGDLRGYSPPGKDIWNGLYVGEIIKNNRLLFKEGEHGEDRGPTQIPNSIPEVPMVPKSIDPMDLPSGYRDL
jgi:hypothetical protein